MADRKEPRSLFEDSWEFMFGWRREKNTVLRSVVVYDTTPATLITVTRSLPLAICQIISGYCGGLPSVTTFELWSYAHGSSAIPDTYLNWYGSLTYGTCWFRGCKVWLTPRAGLMTNISKDAGPFVNAREHKNTVRRIVTRAWHHVCNPTMTYDTGLIPLRIATPKDAAKLVAFGNHDYAVVTQQPRDIDFEMPPFINTNIAKREPERAFAGGLLEKYAQKRGKQPKIRTAGPHNYDADACPSEGGSPEIIVMFDMVAIVNELHWVENTGLGNHGVKFEWL